MKEETFLLNLSVFMLGCHVILSVIHMSLVLRAKKKILDTPYVAVGFCMAKRQLCKITALNQLSVMIFCGQ